MKLLAQIELAPPRSGDDLERLVVGTGRQLSRNRVLMGAAVLVLVASGG